MADKPRNSKGQFMKASKSSSTVINNAGVWFKNAAKSMGYSGYDFLKETIPTSMDTFEANKDFVIDLVKQLKTARTNIRSVGDIKGQLQGRALENINDIESIARNSIEDLKTGKFYNKERQTAMANDGFDDNFGDFGDFGDDDFDVSFDIDDDFNDDNFDDEDSDSPKIVTPNVNITSNINKNNPMVQAINRQSKMMSDSEAIAYKRDVTIANAQMELSRQLTGVLHDGMETINSNLSTLINFNNEQGAGYIGASLKYYEDTTKYLSDMSENLKKLVVHTETTSSYKTDPMNEIFNSDGGINLKEYSALIRKQFSAAADEDMTLGSIKSMLEIEDGLKAIAAQPLSDIPKMLIGKMVPQFLTTTVKSFDETLKSFLPALLLNLGGWSKNGVDLFSDDGRKGFIGKIFGISRTVKTSIDTSKYEKGPVSFDGITRKSIVEVIPGYLSKILSALNGKDELIFDTDSGKFLTRTNLKKEYNDRLDRTARSNFSSIYDVKDRLRSLGLDDYKELNDNVDYLFSKLGKTSTPFNPNITTDENDITRDDINDILNSGSNIAGSEVVEAIRAAILSLSNVKQIKLVSEQYAANNAVTREMEKWEKSGDTLATAMHNGMYTDANSFDAEKSKSIFLPSDKYSKNSLDYLRDIRSILLEGVGVWIRGDDYDYKYKDNMSRKDYYESKDKIKYTNKLENKNSQHYTRTLTDEQKAANLEKGIRNYRDISNIPRDPESLLSIMEDYAAKNEGNLTSDQKNVKKFSIWNLLSDKKERDTTVRTTIEKFRDRAANKFKGLFDYLDTTMYNIVFGTNKGKDETLNKKSFFTNILNNIKTSMKSFKSTLNKFYDGIHKKLFGETGLFTRIDSSLFGKDGLVSKFKESDFYKGLKQKASSAFDFLAGKADGEGKRSGGLFSGVFNSLRDTGLGVKEYITGADKDGKPTKNKTSVFGEIRDLFKGFTKNVKEYLFGDEEAIKDNKKNAGTLFADIKSSFKEGFQTFTDLIFGRKYTTDDDGTTNTVSNLPMDEMMSKIKERAPKTVASGIIGGGAGLLAGLSGFGLLGSLFLGPMSGVVIGSATGFLSQSERFKNWLFGEKDPETDERTGGLLSKTTQKFFKDNKNAMIGGAGLGFINGTLGLGILPSFILGGPITGALFGLGASLITRSETFQNMMFGEKDDDGKRKNGLISKIFKGNDGSGAKKIGFGLAGAGLGAGIGGVLSSFGILGSLAFGPLSGAVIGAGAGIALAADKWKDAIFGKFDEDGNRTENGMLNKLMTAVSIEVLQPAKVQVFKWALDIQDWFEENIAEPFINSMTPIKEELSRLKNTIFEFGYGILERLNIPEFVGGVKDALLENMATIGSGLTSMVKTGTEAISTFTGKILSAPFKALNAIAENILLPKHMREGIREMRKQIFENIKTGFEKSPVGQFLINRIIEPVKEGISNVVDWTKKKIKELFKSALIGMWNLAKKAFGIIARPFKAIGAVKNFLHNMRINGEGYRDTDRLNDIKSGNRTFKESVRDLASSYNPFSSLRRAAAYTGDGADYVDKWAEEREERKAKRQARRDAHQNLKDKLDKQLKGQQDYARGIGYDAITDDDKEQIGIKQYNKIIDDAYKRKYGKSYKNMSSIEQDRFKKQDASTDAVIDTAKTVKDILSGFKDILINGIKIRMPGSEPEYNADGVMYTSFRDVTDEEQSTGASMALVPSSNGSVPKNTTPGTGASLALVPSSNGSIDTTPGKSVFERDAIKSAEDAENRKMSVFDKMNSLIEAGNEERKRHNFTWSSIFSKKGLLTMALIGGAVFILKNFTWSKIAEGFKSILSGFFGTTDKDGNRLDAGGNIQLNDDAVETATMGAVKTAGYGMHALASSKTLKTAGTALSNLGKGADFLYRGTKSVGSKVINKLTKNTKDVASDALKSGIVDDFCKLLVKAATSLEKAVTAKFPNFMSNPLTKKLFSIIAKIGSNTSALMTKTAEITRGLSKIASSSATLFLMDAAFVTYGTVSGSTVSETANLFGVAQEDVDSTMRTVSAIIKGFTSFSWLFVIQLASDIGESLFGINLIRLLAQAMYSTMVGGDTEKIAKLQQSQTNFDSAYTEYTQIQEYLKGNAKLNDDGTITINAGTVVESKDSYNDRVNKSVFGKVTSGIGKGLSAAGRFLFGNKGDEDKRKATEDKIASLKELVSKGVVSEDDNNYITTMKSLEDELKKYTDEGNIFKKVIDVILFPITKGLGGVISAIAEDSKSAFNSIVSGDGVFSKSYWTPPSTDGGLIGSIRNIGFFTHRLATLSPALFVTGIKGVINGAKALGKGLLSVGTSYLEDSKSAISNIMNGNGIFSSEYWEPPADGEGILDIARNIMFFTQRITTAPISLVASSISFVVKNAGSIFNGIKNIASVIDDAYDTDDLELSNYFKFDGDDSGFVGGLSKVLFYTVRGTLLPSFMLGKVVSSIGSKIKEKFGAVGEFFSKVFNIGDVETDDATGGGQSHGGGAGGNRVRYAPYNNRGLGGPLDMMNAAGKVTSEYGNQEGIRSKPHTGIDFSNYNNAPIKSFTDGVVSKVVKGYSPDTGKLGSKDGGGYGNNVRVTDKNGYIHTYAHLNGVNVTEGQNVSEGTVIGIQGHTGNSTGSHLHYDVRDLNGSKINPRDYLKSYTSNSVDSSGASGTTSSTETNNTGLSGIASGLRTALTSMFSPLTQITTELTNSFNSLLGITSDTSSSSDSEATDSVPSNMDVSGVSNANFNGQSIRYSDIKKLSHMSVSDVQKILKNNWVKKNSIFTDNNINSAATGIVQAQEETGLSSIVPLAIGALESGWGTSKIAREKGNLWGWKAYNSNPYGSATNFGNNQYGAFKEYSNNLLATYYDKYGAKTIDSIGTGNNPARKGYAYNNNGTINTTWPVNVASCGSRMISSLGVGGPITEEDGKIVVAERDIFAKKPTDNKTVKSDVNTGGIGGENNNGANAVINYLKEIITGITSIVNNTQSTSNKLDELKTIESEKTTTTNVTAIDNSKKTTNSPMYDIASQQRNKKQNSGAYSTARLIAAGGL